MSDYISRADALAVARYSRDPAKELEQLPGFGWTPASEPPEEEGIYLVRASDGLAYIESYGDFFDKGERIWTRWNVTAWMPIPPEEG